MLPGYKQAWLETIKGELVKIPSIESAWVFGSRARGDHQSKSDLDIAVLIDPDDGKPLAEWIFNASKWKESIQSSLEQNVSIDLHMVDEQADEIVWPAVKKEGKLFYCRDQAKS